MSMAKGVTGCFQERANLPETCDPSLSVRTTTSRLFRKLIWIDFPFAFLLLFAFFFGSSYRESIHITIHGYPQIGILCDNVPGFEIMKVWQFSQELSLPFQPWACYRRIPVVQDCFSGYKENQYMLAIEAGHVVECHTGWDAGGVFTVANGKKTSMAKTGI